MSSLEQLIQGVISFGHNVGIVLIIISVMIEQDAVIFDPKGLEKGARRSSTYRVIGLSCKT